MEAPAVIVEEVSVVYRRTGTAALRGVSMEAPPGTVTVLTGPSGSGKTTLLRVIAGFLMPDSGDVIIGSQRLSRMGKREVLGLRRIMGISFQDPVLIPSLTLRENIEFSIEAAGRKPREYWERVEDLASRLGIVKLLKKYPGEVSGGEARRAHLLTALAHDPQILLLDEPTAYLDEESSRRVASIIREEAGRGKTVIVATHDPLLEEIADRVYRLRYGRLEHRGVRRADED